MSAAPKNGRRPSVPTPRPAKVARRSTSQVAAESPQPAACSNQHPEEGKAHRRSATPPSAVARPLKRRRTRVSTKQACDNEELLRPCTVPMPLTELILGPYFVIAEKMGKFDLCQTDATCKALRRANDTLWRTQGMTDFHGLELESEGIFDMSQDDGPLRALSCVHVDWKKMYIHFRAEAYRFRSPFDCLSITETRTPDLVAYCRSFLRTDLLLKRSDRGLYLEMDVSRNADNVNLGIVDFDEGGESSVTFSPDTGAVIRERKVQETPRRVRGSYIQPLRPRPTSFFEGQMGFYIRGDLLAFFRRCKDDGNDGDLVPWETTGFVIDLQWAEGHRLTPCVAFRDEGPYHVRISKLCEQPPILPQKLPGAFDDANWRELNWSETDNNGNADAVLFAHDG